MVANERKLKLLHLMSILEEETDDVQGLSMPQIIEKLEEAGFSAERKSIYRDIEALRAFGLDIQTLHRSPVEYTLASRDFNLVEVRLLIDSVQSSRFLTQEISDSLTTKIKQLVSVRQRGLLDKQLRVDGRIKMQNESVFANVNLVQQAMSSKKKISFQYFRYDVRKQRIMRRDGCRYIETPVHLEYREGCYYLVAYNEKHDGFPVYRVDRMDDIEILNEFSCRNQHIATFDADKLEKRAFGMYDGEAVSATLVISEGAMDAVIDRFGKDVKSVPIDEKSARVYVPIVKSPAFFGWIAQFGNRVRIEKPQALVAAYCDYLASILQAYED